MIDMWNVLKHKTKKCAHAQLIQIDETYFVLKLTSEHC